MKHLVNNVSEGTTSRDIAGLFSKFKGVNVEDVYIPGPNALGDFRAYAFATVSVEDKGSIDAWCSLNGAVWRGKPLWYVPYFCVYVSHLLCFRIESATESYTSRLEREWTEAAFECMNTTMDIPENRFHTCCSISKIYVSLTVRYCRGNCTFVLAWALVLFEYSLSPSEIWCTKKKNPVHETSVRNGAVISVPLLV
jgi:hypothetical protein